MNFFHAYHGTPWMEGNICHGAKTFCWVSLWMYLVMEPGETFLSTWEVLPPYWLRWLHAPRCRSIETSPPWIQLQAAVLSNVWDLEPHLLMFGEVITGEQQAVTGRPWKNLVHQLEVHHWDHREGFPRGKINKWHLVIVWHGDLRKQVIVLSSLGNYQAVSMVFPPVGLRQVCMLKQRMANAGTGV